MTLQSFSRRTFAGRGLVTPYVDSWGIEAEVDGTLYRISFRRGQLDPATEGRWLTST